jgi:putative transposase
LPGQPPRKTAQSATGYYHEEAGDKLFTFTRMHLSACIRSSATDQDADRAASRETAAMLFWALLASGQIKMRTADGWQSLAEKPSDQTIDLAA